MTPPATRRSARPIVSATTKSDVIGELQAPYPAIRCAVISMISLSAGERACLGWLQARRNRLPRASGLAAPASARILVSPVMRRAAKGDGLHGVPAERRAGAPPPLAGGGDAACAVLALQRPRDLSARAGAPPRRSRLRPRGAPGPEPRGRCVQQ